MSMFKGFSNAFRIPELRKKILITLGLVAVCRLISQIPTHAVDWQALNRAIEQGRADDNEETIKKRFEVYHKQTEPLSKWFEQEGIRNTFTWKGSKEVMLGEIFAFLDSIK